MPDVTACPLLRLYAIMLLEIACDVAEDLADGSYWDSHNDRFWSRYAYKHSGGTEPGGGDAAGTGGQGE